MQAARAEREKLRALQQLDLANAMSQLIGVALGPVSDKPLSVADVLQRGELMAEKQFSQAPRTLAYLQIQLASLWASVERWDFSQALLSKARANAERAGDLEIMTDADCTTSVIQGRRGEFVKARALIDSAMARLRAARPDLTEPIVSCLRHRAVLSIVQGQPDAGLADVNEAIALAANQRLDKPGVPLRLRETRANALAGLGRLAPAIQEYEAVLAEFQERGVMDTTAMSFNLNTFAVMLLRAGQNLRALQVIEQDIQARQISNADGALDSVLRSNYVSALHAIGRIDQAMPHVERGLEEALSSNEPRKRGEVGLRAAEVLCDTNALARCESLIDLSAKNFAIYMSPTHPTLARLNLLRAKVAIDRRSPELAREHIARALGIMDKTGKPDGRRVIALGQLAQAELMLGERDLALKHADEAVAYARLHFADFHASRWSGMAMLSLGQVRRERGELKPATDALQSAKTQLDAALGADSPVARNATRELTELTKQK